MIALIEALTATGHRGGVHLIGNSMGGAVAVRVAASRPDLVKTLTLISPALPDRLLRRETVHFPVIALPVQAVEEVALLDALSGGREHRRQGGRHRIRDLILDGEEIGDGERR